MRRAAFIAIIALSLLTAGHSKAVAHNGTQHDGRKLDTQYVSVYITLRSHVAQVMRKMKRCALDNRSRS